MLRIGSDTSPSRSASLASPSIEEGGISSFVCEPLLVKKTSWDLDKIGMAPTNSIAPSPSGVCSLSQRSNFSKFSWALSCVARRITLMPAAGQIILAGTTCHGQERPSSNISFGAVRTVDPEPELFPQLIRVLVPGDKWARIRDPRSIRPFGGWIHRNGEDGRTFTIWQQADFIGTIIHSVWIKVSWPPGIGGQIDVAAGLELRNKLSIILK
eukprot:scaffold227107_cov30-Tisochrysis_lutea.AAC.3